MKALSRFFAVLFVWFALFCVSSAAPVPRSQFGNALRTLIRNAPKDGSSFGVWFKTLSEPEKNGLIELFRAAGLVTAKGAPSFAHGARLAANLRHISTLRTSTKWPRSYTLAGLLNGVDRLKTWTGGQAAREADELAALLKRLASKPKRYFSTSTGTWKSSRVPAESAAAEIMEISKEAAGRLRSIQPRANDHRMFREARCNGGPMADWFLEVKHYPNFSPQRAVETFEKQAESHLRRCFEAGIMSNTSSLFPNAPGIVFRFSASGSNLSTYETAIKDAFKRQLNDKLSNIAEAARAPLIDGFLNKLVIEAVH